MRNADFGTRNRTAVASRPRRVRSPGFYSALRNPHSAFAMIRYDFAGKVALVTGSSRGIGAAILEGFAAAGATCVLHYWDDPDGANKKDAEALAARLGGSGIPFRDESGRLIGTFTPTGSKVH